METDNQAKTFKIYISHDASDQAKAEKLQNFLVKNGTSIQCNRRRYKTSQDQRYELLAVCIIRPGENSAIRKQ